MRESKYLLALITAATLGLSGCAKSLIPADNNVTDDDGDVTPVVTNVTLTGQLAMSGSGTTSMMRVMPNARVGALDASDYSISCATFEASPKACGGPVAANGSFSVTCEGFASIPFGCFVFNTVTFKNSPITFNINDEGEKSAVNLAGTISNVEITLDLDTGLAAAAATVAAESVVAAPVLDSNAIQGMNGTWALAVRPYAQVADKYTANDFTVMKRAACRRNYFDNVCDYQIGNCSEEEMMTYCATNAPLLTNQQAYELVMAERMGDGSFTVLFEAVSDGSKHSLFVWPSVAAKNACTKTDGKYNWRFNDVAGATGAVALDFGTATGCNEGESPAACLTRKLGTSVVTMTEKWLPMFSSDVAEDGGTATDVTAGCKYMYDLYGDIWNPQPALVDRCMQDEACSRLAQDPINAARMYVFSKIYSGSDHSADTILGNSLPDKNFSDNVVADSSATLGYGYRTWTPEGELWNVVSGESRVDIGGCLQWPDWAKCQNGGCTTPQLTTVVEVGKNVIQYGPDPDSTADDQTWKCGMSEKRLLVANPDGFIVLKDGTKYFEAQPFITIGAETTKRQTWSKVCEVAFTKNSAQQTWYQTYPVDYDSTRVAQEALNSANGGSPEQRRGMVMSMLYEQIREAGKGGGGGGGGDDFQFWNGTESISCSDIQAGTVPFSKIDLAFDNVRDPWGMGKLVKCVMIGLFNHQNDDTNGYKTVADEIKQMTNGAAVFAGFEESAVGSGTPKVFAALGTHSCLPQFQMTSMCTNEGYCEPKVICSDYLAADGGCSTGAQPMSLMASLKVEALPENKFNFFEKSTWFDVRFNPSTNANTVCQRSEFMTITTQDSISSSVAPGTAIGMAFDTREAEVNLTNSALTCQGQPINAASKDDMAMKMYTIFTKQ